MNSPFFSLFFLSHYSEAKEKSRERRKLLHNGILIFLCVFLLTFRAFLSSFIKVFFSHLKSQHWLLISTIERTTGEQKRNASNLVNWVKCFEYWVLCYHKIGIYWEIGNNVECLALSATQKRVSIPSHHCFTWMLVECRTLSVICIHCYRRINKKKHFRAMNIIWKSYRNFTYQDLYTRTHARTHRHGMD